MFDILTDVWAHPGAVHAPVLPFDISELSANDADRVISDLHKHGYDSLLVFCREGTVLCDGVLEAIFAAAAKRFMLIFADESVVLSATSCTDSAFTSFNPMLMSHRLSLVPEGSELSPLSESVASLYIKTENGKLTDVQSDLGQIEDATGYEKYSFVMESTDGLDILCPETCEMLIFGAYETFLAEYKEVSGGTLVGLYTSRLSVYNNNTVFWSYDMLEDFKAVGGNLKMLVSLFISGDKRSEKEGRRLYNKALSARLETSFCRTASEWCGRNSLAFVGDAPLRFASNCGRRFTLPVWTREGYPLNCESDHDIISGVRFLGDLARGEGFTGSAYKAISTDADSLVRELNAAFAASCALVILPEKFGDPSHLDSVGIGREDMRRLCTRIKRMSTLGTSCGSKTSVAILCDDDFIPYQGAEKLRSMGADFNFISKAQIMEKGRTHHGELLIDKFRYSSLLIDQRIRLEPGDVMKIGEFASYGGTMYRGGSFGDFAKRNIDIDPFMKEAASSLIVYETEKCSCPFKLLVNRTDSPVKIRLGESDRQCYILDIVNGKKYAVSANTELRILPNSTLTLAYDPSGEMCESATFGVLSEIVALNKGVNAFNITNADSVLAVIELDSIEGCFVDAEVNTKKVSRILFPPYTADVTSLLKEGENVITLSSDSSFSGAVLRIFSNEI